MLQSYLNDGYVIVENFIGSEEIRALKDSAARIIQEDKTAKTSIFSSVNQLQTTDDYFLGSGDTMRCFFEEAAYDENGQLIVPKEKAINKIGHALHECSPTFKFFSFQPKINSILKTLGFEKAKLLQSMYIFKQPQIGGEVLPHQDACYLHTSPQRVVGLWFALEDATLKNGCLHVLPGGHTSKLSAKFIRSDNGLEMKQLNEANWDPNKFIPVEVAAGTLVVLHDHLPHKSSPNLSNRSRQAYTLHVADGNTEFTELNWLRKRAPFPEYA